jgi:hypothetical protein
MAQRVASLVNDTIKYSVEQQAFSKLEALGPAAVPYIVSHLGDMRPLPEHEISLANNSPDAFEGFRHYSPETVHDALSAILNQLTGQSFAPVYNGATPTQRQANRMQWQVWCARAYPTNAAICSG